MLWQSASRSSFSSLTKLLVLPLKFIYSSMWVYDVLALTVHCKLINFVFQIFPLLIRKHRLASHLTLFRLSPFISLGSCNHCNLACFLRSNNFEHPSSNHGFCFFKFGGNTSHNSKTLLSTQSPHHTDLIHLSEHQVIKMV
jgi:hypothetical protein